MNTSKKLKVGDEVWYMPYVETALAVKCKITDIYVYQNKTWASVKSTEEIKEEDAIPHFALDEPVGHLVMDDELFVDRKSVIEEMTQYVTNLTLSEYRDGVCSLIAQTHHADDKEKQKTHKEDLLKKYPDKQRGKDWFNIFDLSSQKEKHLLVKMLCILKNVWDTDIDDWADNHLDQEEKLFIEELE